MFLKGRVGAGGDPAGEVEVGGVAADGLDTRDRRGAAPVDHADGGALVEEGGGDGPAGGAGAEDHVGAGGHDGTVVAGTNVSMMVLWARVKARAAAIPKTMNCWSTSMP